MISTCFDEGILKEFQDSGKKGEGQYIGHMYTYKQISIYIFFFNYYCFIYFLIIIEYSRAARKKIRHVKTTFVADDEKKD